MDQNASKSAPKNVSKSAITGGILAGRVGPGRRLRLFDLRFNNARAKQKKSKLIFFVRTDVEKIHATDDASINTLFDRHP